MQDVEERAEAGSEGAMERLARDPSSRKRFLKMTGGAGAAGAFSLLLAACGSSDNKDKTTGGGSAAAGTGRGSKPGDLKILNHALTLEYLEAEFYKEVVASGKVKNKQVAELAKKFGDTEQQHVEALTATISKLGGTPVTAPKTKFQPIIDGGEKKILTTAAAVENLGAAAYLGQAGRIKSAEVLAAALAIHSVEARHASALNTALGKPVTPDGAFAKPAAMAEVLMTVKPFLA